MSGVERGALSGLRVIDATQMLAGPLAGSRLGDLGADVIKLEPPGSGEFNRTHGISDTRVSGEMTTFLAVNRNKRSLAVDLKRAESSDVIEPLIRSADVFIQNFRHGTAARLGVGWQRLLELNPRLIYCSISGYGADGPHRDRPGQDLVLQGYSGSMFSVGSASDGPQPGALWAADVMTGYQAVIGILAAVESRHASGVGQHVEVDMLSVVLDAQLQEMVTYLNTGFLPGRTAEKAAHTAMPAPYGAYQTKDGWMTLAMSPLNLLGELLGDEWLTGLTDYNDGHRYRDEAYARIRHAFVGRTTAEWLVECDRLNIWAGPVYDYADVVADPHVVSTGMIVEQPLEGSAPIRTMRPPLKMSDTPPSVRLGAPRLGADTETILQSLGLDSSKISQLVTSGVVAISQPQSPTTAGASE
jgi:crotonobetainyl-CoA:carnitine CoA-transferase CaiB-like acyl-CoA transferase